MSKRQAAPALRSMQPTIAVPQRGEEQSRGEFPANQLRLAHEVMGNRATGNWVQEQLNANVPSDAYQHETDRATEQAIRMSTPASAMTFTALGLSPWVSMPAE